MSQAESTRYQRRGLLGILVLAVPAVSIVSVGIAYAVFLWYGAAGRPAEGAQVRIDFDACPEAAPVVEARIEAMGLPDAAVTLREGGFVATARLPSDPRIEAEIPATLSAKGEVEVRAGEDGEVLASRADVGEVAVSMSFLDSPRVWLKLKPEPTERLRQHMGAKLDGFVSVWVDGELVTRRKNAPPIDDGEIDVLLEDGDERARVEWVAAMGIVLGDGPLPCPVSVRSVTKP